MTKSAVMEPTESIYEEIMTRDVGKTGNIRLDRSVSCPASRKSSPVIGKHNSLSHLRQTQDNDESLYAVVNGEDIEFKKLKDLLEDGSSCRNIYHNDKQSARAKNIAQTVKTNDDKDYGECDSGCDCTLAGKDAAQTTQIPHLLRPTTLNVKDSETVYSEILHQTPGSQVDLFPGRLTRESENPLLRQEVIPSNTPSPSTSIPPSRNGSLRRSRNDESIRSTSGDSGIQEDMNTASVYENCARRDRKLRRSLSSPQFYANSVSLKSISDSLYQNMEKNEAEEECTASSMYANMEDDTVDSRPRASSRPIAIQSNQRKIQTELIYSDLDFVDEPVPEYLSSSPGDASSTSSGLSSFTTHLTNSFSPPPLPSRPPSVYARRRQTSFSSVSMTSSFAPSSLKANFIGTHAAHRASKNNINTAIKETVHKTNMLDIKSVYIEVTKKLVKFCSMSSPYNCVLQFSVDDIHIMDHYSKDQRFIGFVVSQPGKEAACHVFQSDQTSEILEAVRDVFKENPLRQRFNTPERPKSYYGQPERHNQYFYPGIIKIGSLKVKNSLLVINDSIHALLEKVNPKEYARVNLEIKDSSTLTVTSESGLKGEEHSIAWILSLGLYNHDGRYFGYIVSRTKGGKTRMFCHVYKCSNVMMSATILEGIRSACQNTLAPERAQPPRCSNSVPRSAFRSRPLTSPDAVSRSSTSSDETMRDTGSPRLMHTSEYGESTPKIVRGLSFENEKSELASKMEHVEQVLTGQTDSIGKQEMAEPGQNMQSGDVVELREMKIVEESSDQTDFILNSDSATVSNGVPNKVEDKASVVSPAVNYTENHTMSEVGFKADSSAVMKRPEDKIEAKEVHKDKKSKSKSKIFRGSLIRKKKDPTSKLSASMQSLDFVPREEEEFLPAPIKEEHNFVISYLCSAVVKPPLKSKHVEKCLKQYQKEMGKKQKVGDVCSLGNKLSLKVITDEGVTMLDIRNPNSFRRHFPISTIDTFIVHPENPDCFAFSTTVPGDEQHKYHLFYKARESIATVKDAFEHLKLFQKAL